MKTQTTRYTVVGFCEDNPEDAWYEVFDNESEEYVEAWNTKEAAEDHAKRLNSQ